MLSLDQLRHCVSADTETTGTDEKEHAMISLGATCFHTDDEFYREFTLPAECVYDPDALRVNGESEEALRARSTPEFTDPLVGILEFWAWCRERELGVIIGKSPSFDHRFLRQLWNNHGLDDDEFIKVLPYRYQDWTSFVIPLYMHAGKTIPQQGLRNIDLYTFLRVPDEARPHNALTGAQHNKNCVKRIIDMYNAAS